MSRTFATTLSWAALVALFGTLCGCNVKHAHREQYNGKPTPPVTKPAENAPQPVVIANDTLPTSGNVKAELESFNDDATFNVELYSTSGDSIRKWEGVSNYERGMKSKCVRFMHSGKIHRIYGTIIVEATEKVETKGRQAEYDITLYGSDGIAIREWHAFDVTAEWDSERCQFTEAETGRVFASYGTIVIQQK